jgi:hypothetical protein
MIPICDKTPPQQTTKYDEPGRNTTYKRWDVCSALPFGAVRLAWHGVSWLGMVAWVSLARLGLASLGLGPQHPENRTQVELYSCLVCFIIEIVVLR